MFKIHWMIGLACVAGLGATLPALERDEARHLLFRTGFGATPSEIESLLPLSREQAVDAIIDSTHEVARTPLPDWCKPTLAEHYQTKNEEYATYKDLKGEERQKKQNEYNERDRRRGHDLKAWWYHEMIITDSPLTERMTLFWHNHFTSQLRTVEDPRLMFEQNITLRTHALENFAFMLRDMNTDPAMFRYLDSDSNVSGRPNENYAREVMELFTLGEGKYSEADIKEAARAFTGYKIDEKTGRAALREGPHDQGWKVVLGKKGQFNAEDIIVKVLLLSEERVATYISEKIWREFVSDTLDEKEVYKLAGTFFKSKYNIKKLLRATFLTKQFWDPANRGVLFKSPVELLVGAARALQLPASSAEGFVKLGARLGEDILDPPNVKGWKGGTSWISSESLLTRWEVSDDLLRGHVGEGSAPEPDMMMGGMMSGDNKKDADKKDDKKDDKKESGKETKKDSKKEDKKEDKKDDKKDEPTKPSLVLVPKPWISDARGKGVEGAQLAIECLLPIAPVTEVKPDSGFDTVLRGILHDPAFNLK